MRRWGQALREEATRQADRAFLWLVVAFGAGAALFFAWRKDPATWVTLGLCIAGAALYPFRLRAPALAFAALAVLALGLGHGAAAWRTARVATPLLARESRALTITADVVEAEKRTAGNRIVIANFTLPDVRREDTPKRLRLSMPQSHGLPAVGERISLRAVVRPAPLPVVPDGFQFQRFLYFSEIGGVGYAVGRWQPAEADGEATLRARFKAWSEGLRRTIGARITAVIPGDEGAVGAALVNGEQNAIPEDLQEAYRASGIAHLLSISGVHMSLLAGIVFFIVRRALALAPSIALRIDTKKCAAAVGLAATGFYLVISGMSVPAVRSFMMIAVVMLAVLLDRTALSLRTIAWAALVLLAIYPDAIFGASFQMSFIAVLALIALYEQAWLRTGWRNAEGEFNLVRVVAIYVAGLVITDIVAGGTTALFAAYHFNRLPTYSAFTNLIAVPLTGLWIMPAGILGLLLMPFGWDMLPFKVMGAGVAMLNDVARTVAGWPHAQIHVPPFSTWALALAALGVVWVCLWRGPRRWAGLALVLPALLQPALSAPPDVIIDDSARVFAISDADGALVLRPGRTGRFAREAWTDRYGESKAKWNEVEGLACDAAGCVLDRHGAKVLLAFAAEALAEDCGESNLAISAVASRDLCRGQRVIDIIDLRRDGALAIWLSPSGARTRTVRDATGNRVWMRGVSGEAD